MDTVAEEAAVSSLMASPLEETGVERAMAVVAMAMVAVLGNQAWSY